MKSNAIRLLAVFAVSGFLALGGESLLVTPTGRSSYEVVESPVLKVYTVQDNKHRFVSYLVKWKGSEVIVSDTLAQSNYEIGDTISFLALKTTVEQDGVSVNSLSFQLRPMDK